MKKKLLFFLALLTGLLAAPLAARADWTFYVDISNTNWSTVWLNGHYTNSSNQSDWSGNYQGVAINGSKIFKITIDGYSDLDMITFTSTSGYKESSYGANTQYGDFTKANSEANWAITNGALYTLSGSYNSATVTANFDENSVGSGSSVPSELKLKADLSTGWSTSVTLTKDGSTFTTTQNFRTDAWISFYSGSTEYGPSSETTIVAGTAMPMDGTSGFKLGTDVSGEYTVVVDFSTATPTATFTAVGDANVRILHNFDGTSHFTDGGSGMHRVDETNVYYFDHNSSSTHYFRFYVSNWDNKAWGSYSKDYDIVAGNNGEANKYNLVKPENSNDGTSQWSFKISSAKRIYFDTDAKTCWVSEISDDAGDVNLDLTLKFKPREERVYGEMTNPAVFLLGDYLNNNTIAPDWEMTRSADGTKYVIRNVTLRGANNGTGTNNSSAYAINAKLSAVMVDTDGTTVTKKVTVNAPLATETGMSQYGRVFDVTYNVADQTLTFSDLKNGGRPQYFGFVGAEIKQPKDIKTPRNSSITEDKTWQEAYIFYDEDGYPLKGTDGKYFYSTQWPPRNTVYFAGSSIEMNSDQLTFQRDNASGAKTTAEWQAMFEAQYGDDKTIDQTPYAKLFTKDAGVTYSSKLKDGNKYVRYTVNNMWIDGMVKIWTGWGGQSHNGGTDALWDNHANFGFACTEMTGSAMHKDETHKNLKEGEAYEFRFGGCDFGFAKPTYFKKVELYIPVNDDGTINYNYADVIDSNVETARPIFFTINDPTDLKIQAKAVKLDGSQSKNSGAYKATCNASYTPDTWTITVYDAVQSVLESDDPQEWQPAGVEVTGTGTFPGDFTNLTSSLPTGRYFFYITTTFTDESSSYAMSNVFTVANFSYNLKVSPLQMLRLTNDGKEALETELPFMTYRASGKRYAVSADGRTFEEITDNDLYVKVLNNDKNYDWTSNYVVALFNNGAYEDMMGDTDVVSRYDPATLTVKMGGAAAAPALRSTRAGSSVLSTPALSSIGYWTSVLTNNSALNNDEITVTVNGYYTLVGEGSPSTFTTTGSATPALKLPAAKSIDGKWFVVKENATAEVANPEFMSVLKEHLIGVNAFEAAPYSIGVTGTVVVPSLDNDIAAPTFHVKVDSSGDGKSNGTKTGLGNTYVVKNLLATDGGTFVHTIDDTKYADGLEYTLRSYGTASKTYTQTHNWTEIEAVVPKGCVSLENKVYYVNNLLITTHSAMTIADPADYETLAAVPTEWSCTAANAIKPVGYLLEAAGQNDTNAIYYNGLITPDQLDGEHSFPLTGGFKDGQNIQLALTPVYLFNNALAEAANVTLGGGSSIRAMRASSGVGGVVTYGTPWTSSVLAENQTTGLESLLAEDAAAEADYYTLQGLRVAEPVDGNVYIVRRDGKASKEVYRAVK